MKRSLIAAASLLLLISLQSAQTPSKIMVVADDDLKPTIAQESAEKGVANFFSSYHFKKFKLNDSLSNAMFDNYLDQIDPFKYYFLEEDVKQFGKYRNQLDEALQEGRLEAAYDIYNVYRKRYRERTTYLETTLKNPKFDFATDESINTDRKKLVWAKDQSELDERWRKVIKSDALDFKIRYKSDSTVVAKLQERYSKGRERALGRIKSEQVFQMYMNAFCETLDPHTRYFSPTDSDRFKQEMYKSLEGIGAQLREDGNHIKIVEVMPGGPAAKDKRLKANDKIVAVGQGENGPMEDIVGWYIDDAIKKIKGPKGTIVRLQVIPADGGVNAPLKEVKLVREKINIQEARVTKEIIKINHNKVDYNFGVITIPSFYRDFDEANRRSKEFNSTTIDVQKILDTLKTAKVDGVIIDLRNNGGGSLTEAINLTGLFINKGPVVQVRESTGGAEVYTDRDPAIHYEGPLAVISNRFSASASEIFAAAIQDYKRGIVVGEQSYGKGTVQTMVDLNQFLGGSEKLGQINITVQKFYRINGSSTQRKGVMPDITFPSMFKDDEYRESSEKAALSWEQVGTARYEVTKYLNEKQIAKLKDRYSQRQKSDNELKAFAQELENAQKARENTIVSLQESKRRKQREEDEKRSKALAKLMEVEDEEDDDATPKATDKKKKKLDIYLKETQRILADYIVLSRTGDLAKK